jgi:hypothetical protein
MLTVALAAALSILAAVTYQIFDTDYWQHLTVAKAIWRLGFVPHTQLWSWPTYGAPDVNSSWGFRVLVWPFWELGGVMGLFLWRWLTTLAAFGILWAVARRLGARGASALVVLVLSAWVYRQRSQIRPETLVAILLAIEIWILETRRRGGKDLSLALPAIAWVWANVHISWHFGFVILGIYAAEALATRRRPPAESPAAPRPSADAGVAPAPDVALAPPSSPARGPARLLLAAAMGFALSFLNPFGWRALWQPFDFTLHMRGEPIFRIISELQPINWSLNNRNGLALLLVGWPLLLLWRARRSGLDLVELLLCGFFTYLAVGIQRFIGFYALVAAPFVARDLDAWIGSRRWPVWARHPGGRAALAMGLCAAIAMPELLLNDPPFGVGILMKNYPVAACDSMARWGVRGRGYNPIRNGGYLLWRFWPERDRLPFIDTHQAGTPELRRLYVDALLGPDGWRALDQTYRFDWALLSRPQAPGDRMLDNLDADTLWTLAFVDDAGALYLRRSGPMAALAARHAYRELGAGAQKLLGLAAACDRDSALRARVRVELDREIAESPTSALAHSMLANLALAEQDFDGADAELRRALAKDPGVPRAYERIGIAALSRGKPRDALAAFERERRRGGATVGLDLLTGMAYLRIGDLSRARVAYRAASKRDPTDSRVQLLRRAIEAAESK